MTETLTYNGVVPKDGWGDGPWQSEPDKMQWADGATGYPCLAVRHHLFGHWCGYVGVTPLHPLYRVQYTSLYDTVFDSENDDVYVTDVHGGITYSAECSHGGDESASICHIPSPGEPDDVWWFGFDCAHAGDYQPGMRSHMRESGVDIEPFETIQSGDEYRDLEYVKTECAVLAGHLQRWAKEH